MSPSEFDLRAALREGEDDAGLDVDATVAGVRARRAHARTRVLSVTAAVVVVAGAATAGAVIWGGSGGSPSAQGTASAALPSVANGPDLPAQSGAAAAAPGGVCPAQYPQVALPGGGSPGQFGSGGTMFDQPVASLIVCGYGSGQESASNPVVRVYTGTDATALAASIENAARTTPTARCPDVVLTQPNRLVIVARTSGGAAERLVTTTLSLPICSQLVTNGTAVRYAWRPPTAYLPALLALHPAATVSIPPSAASGTPGAVPGSAGPSAAVPTIATLPPTAPPHTLDGSPAR